MLPRRLLSSALLALAACGAPPPAPRPSTTTAAPSAPGYRATVRWTGFDVPHVVAADLGSLGFGQGWAHARQHLCRLADQFVRVAAQRARYFGPGPGDANLDSDLLHLALDLDRRVEAQRPRQSADAAAIAAGWVAGYNHYLATTPPAQWPEPCRGAPWVRPVDERDLARFGLALAALASSRAFQAPIARAAPTPAGDRGAALPPLPGAPRDALASNAWALGGDRTESGGGLVVANPHFPWEGDLTFSELHLTVPGVLDVYGAGIPGVPLVGIGFTAHHAWTHTFSSSTRFLLHRLRLVDGDPLRYHRDDGTEAIEARRVVVEVLQPDGALQPVERVLYRSVHGPMIASSLTPWADGAAYALRDVALDSAGSAIDLYLGFARATSAAEFRAALTHRATPFLNTLYADAAGEALYVDGSAVANLSPEALAAWEFGRRMIPALQAAWDAGIPVVDGSSSTFDPVTDDPAEPGGVIPVAAAPTLVRRDFVFNANDSYGFTNPAAPLVGFSPLYGAAAEALSPRSLANLRPLRARGDASPAGPEGTFSRAEAIAAMLSNRSFTGEQLRDELLARCRAESRRRGAAAMDAPGGGRRGKPGRTADTSLGPRPDPSLEPLCDRLAEWDLQFDVDSRGAALWREWTVALEAASGGGLPWAVAFDPAAPSTPSGLGTPAGPGDPAIAALETAAEVLRSVGVDVRARSVRLGDLQRAAVGSRGPVPGGGASDGVASVVLWRDWNGTLLPRATRGAPLSDSGLTADGYPVNYGTSWLMAVEFLPGGPAADVLLAYGPPRRPGADGPDDDPLAMLVADRLRPALFREADVLADPDLQVFELHTGP